jgi:dTDP-4-dehydrorhamnose reductase
MSATSPGVLVTGVSGMIGSNLAAACRDRGWRVYGTYRQTPVALDGCVTAGLALDDPDAVTEAVAAWQVGTIIHCAASVELSALETRPDLIAQNVRAAAATVQAAEQGGCRYVLVSSDWVFAGTIPDGDRYREDDQRQPVNAYGRSKAASEEAVESSAAEWLITRPANVYGVNWSVPAGPQSRDEHVRRRSSLAVRWLGRLARGEDVLVPDGVIQSPTSAWSYAARVCDLIDAGAAGIVNTAGPEASCRAGYVRQLAAAFSFSPGSVRTVSAGSALEADGESPALPLPANTALSDHRLRDLARPLCDLAEGLATFRRHLQQTGVSI